MFEDTVRALERKQGMEREFLIYLLQGRESTQARSAARKLSAGNCKYVKNVKGLFMLLHRFFIASSCSPVSGMHIKASGI